MFDEDDELDFFDGWPSVLDRDKWMRLYTELMSFFGGIEPHEDIVEAVKNAFYVGIEELDDRHNLESLYPKEFFDYFKITWGWPEDS